MIDMQKSRFTAVMMLILSLLALSASLIGVLNRAMYEDMQSNAMMPGTFSQDIVSLAAGLLLAILSIVFLKRQGHKTFIAMLGLTGHFFYGYGLFAMTGLYTSLYLVYLIVFGLSIYSLIYGLISFKPNEIKDYQLPGALRKSIGIFLVVIVLIFVPLWLAALIPDTLEHTRADAYAVFVMDLCIVMPAFGIIAAMLLRNKPLGNILAGVVLVKILTLITSVAIGESFAPLYDIEANYGMIAIYSAVAIISLILSIFYMLNFKKEAVN